MSISMKIGEIDPSGLIMDVVSLADPVYLGFTVTVYNNDDVGLYLQITGSKLGWTFDTVNLGLVGSGGNKQQNLDNFCHRAKPSSETSEQITLILKGYTDSGYSNLKWTYTKIVDVWWVKSDDGSWTQNVLNNFDDGTVQGWSATAEENGTVESFTVATDFIISAPYSAKMTYRNTTAGFVSRSRISKSFVTPNKNYVLAIAELRVSCARSSPDYAGAHALLMRKDGTVILQLGILGSTSYSDLMPRNKWMRLIVTLPKNVTVELQIAYEWCDRGSPQRGYLWIDDFRLISKD